MNEGGCHPARYNKAMPNRQDIENALREAMRARDEKPSIAYIYPKEGYTGWMDNLAEPKGAPDLENFMRDRSQAVDAELAFRIHALDRARGPRRHDAIRTYDLAEALVDDDQVIANGVEVIDVAAVVPVQISAHLFTKHLVAQPLGRDDFRGTGGKPHAQR